MNSYFVKNYVRFRQMFILVVILALSIMDGCTGDKSLDLGNIAVDDGQSFYDFEVQDIYGKPVSLQKYKGKVTLVVNVASECGYTNGHYKGLVSLQKKYKHQGFTVLAFPCNQFGAQEPGSNAEILNFAEKNYRINFPMFGKVDVIGDKVSSAWKFLTDQFGEEPNWNFWKYLVDWDGQVVNAWGPWTSLDEIEEPIKLVINLDEDTTEQNEDENKNSHEKDGTKKPKLYSGGINVEVVKEDNLDDINKRLEKLADNVENIEAEISGKTRVKFEENAENKKFKHGGEL